MASYPMKGPESGAHKTQASKNMRHMDKRSSKAGTQATHEPKVSGAQGSHEKGRGRR